MTGVAIFIPYHPVVRKHVEYDCVCGLQNWLFRYSLVCLVDLGLGYAKMTGTFLYVHDMSLGQDFSLQLLVLLDERVQSGPRLRQGTAVSGGQILQKCLNHVREVVYAPAVVRG